MPKRRAPRKYKAKRRIVNRRGRIKYRTRLPSKVHRFKRLGFVATVQNSTVAGALNIVDNNTILVPPAPANVVADTYGYQFPVSMQFQLNKAIDNNDFTQLYDRYRIDGVKIKITPLQNVSTAGGTGLLPMVCYTQDFDDSALAGSYEDVARKGYAKTKTLSRPVSIFIRPKVSQEIYSGNLVAPGYSVVKPMWLDCNSNTIPHYGLKMWFRNTQLPANATGALQCFRFETIYYLSLKDTQ